MICYGRSKYLKGRGGCAAILEATRIAKKARSQTVRTKALPLLEARGSSLQWRVVCSSSLGHLLTGTWQRQNINKFPVVGWQARRCGAVPPCYHTCTAKLSSARSSMLGSTPISCVQQILKAQVLSALLQGVYTSPATCTVTLNS